jgi:methionyl-tRNA formyltransferase
MKIIVIGYSQMFASLVLGSIEAGHQVVGILRHDRILLDSFWLKIKDIFAPSKDKSFIDAYNLNEIKAQSVNSQKFIKEALKLNPDIIFVASWSEKISQKVINLPKIGCINCHPSLLPKYRGPNPYAQVIKTVKKKKYTFSFVDNNYDTGPILHQQKWKLAS